MWSSTLARCAGLVLLAVALFACKGKKKGDTTSAVAPSAQPDPGGGVAAPPELDGTWRIHSAADPNGKKYSGNVQIARTGEAWEMVWRLADGSAQSGIAMDLGNGSYAAGFGGTQAFGVVVYEVASGTLTGKWAQQGIRQVGVENLSGPPGLSGNYTIILAKTPTGGTYTGSVRITPNGQVYDLAWVIGGQTQRGVAILEGSKLIAGWGMDKGAGVIRYKRVTPTRLEAIWAPTGSARTGTEILER